MTKARKTDKSESEVMDEVADAWSENFAPGVLWRQNAGQGLTLSGTRIPLGPTGISDYVGFLPGGWIVFVEVKKRTGKLRASQVKWRKMVTAAGCIFVVARSGPELVRGIHAECAARGITPPGRRVPAPAP